MNLCTNASEYAPRCKYSPNVMVSRALSHTLPSFVWRRATTMKRKYSTAIASDLRWKKKRGKIQGNENCPIKKLLYLSKHVPSVSMKEPQ